MTSQHPNGSPRLVALVLLAAACGSSAMGGGIAGTSSVLGAISGFGSIVVGGIEFETDGAEVTIEGDPVSASALALGMVAFVRGTVEPGGRRGVADLVAVENLAEGPIESIDPSAGRLRLLGQQVVVDAATVFEPPFEQLRVGETVDVGGFLDASGRIRATRIALKLVDREIELRGFIADLDRSAETFRLGELLVDVADAVIENPPPGGLSDGLFVEVEAEVAPVDDRFEAVGVTVLDPALPTEEGDGAEIQGFVTAILSATDFVVNGGQAVRITPDTRFERGDASDLSLNAAVEVSGFANADGVLIADEVEFLQRTE